ncbi:hypothetical protein WA158_007006 [Blastocystis sp. Blastoise]
MKAIGFIGCGNMATAIVKGFVSTNTYKSEEIGAYHISEKYRDDYKSMNIEEFHSIESLVDNCSIIVLCVKPHILLQMIESPLSSEESFSSNKLFISIAAGVTLDTLYDSISPKGAGIIRLNPNTPCLVKEGIFGLSAHKSTLQSHVDHVIQLFSSLGKVFTVSESSLDAFTTLTGCGPAFAFMFIDALADAGVFTGLPREMAIQLASQMLKGSAEMVLQTKQHPDVLRDQVCSPGGSTIEGVYALEKGGFRATTMDAVLASFNKNKKLGKKN